MPTAQVGPENPLPPLFSVADLHAVVDAGDADAEMRRNIGYGRVSSVLPYLVQDGYGREPSAGRAQGRGAGERRPARHLPAGPRWPAVVPRAQAHRSRAAAPEPGPPAGEPRPAQRVVRRRRGVEHRDHRALPHHLRAAARCPRRCSRTARRCLRMYEFERLREVVFQVDAWLPEDSPVLLVHVRIVNPSDVEVPDLLVVQRRGAPVGRRTRPRTRGRGLAVRLRPAPASGPDPRLRRDGTAPTRRARPRPPTTSSRSTTTSVAGSLRWTAGAADWCRPRPTCFAAASCSCGEGAPAGTTGRSGSSGPGEEYLEIQAGLARTQLEHLPMPGRASWAWVEAYGLLESDAGRRPRGRLVPRAPRRGSGPRGAGPPGSARPGARGHRVPGPTPSRTRC